ncbi:hypothetical protein [Portibacter lacus]|uniref:Uncharacterized protein n=1 Tax=Portibacter lacus TaxID=1099794 RepID=A0AA37SKL0_9BACT|nr:hypothetical protein [Portibacter lacus]GLR15587.1 hypothetical protein GCM10007940_02020 [Portibacter lacus]
MRILVFFIFIFSQQLSAQKDLQFIKLKNEDRSVDLSVINHSDKFYTVSVNVELTEMTTDAVFPLKLKIEPNTKVSIAKLKPTSEKATHYLINYKIEKMENSTLVYEPNITIYTKNKHKRSTQLLIYLNQNGIAYNEINTSYNGDTEQMYLDMLKRRGIDKKDSKLPVIIYRGEAFYDIKNVKKFCKTHFENEGHFIKKKDRRY